LDGVPESVTELAFDDFFIVMPAGNAPEVTCQA
jgi:hypothetical protein